MTIAPATLQRPLSADFRPMVSARAEWYARPVVGATMHNRRRAGLFSDD